MMNILVACDSFKGSLTSKEANQIIAEVFEEKGFSVVKKTIADGGEGSIEAFVEAGAKKYFLPTVNSLGEPIQAAVAYQAQQKILMIESAQASGIQYCKGTKDSHPKYTSSYGTGLLLKRALDKFPAQKVYLMLGGTGTIDAGIGFGEALGVKFYTQDGTPLINIKGKDLATIARLDTSLAQSYLAGIDFCLGSDVTAPLCGSQGAVYQFGKQKGLLSSEQEDYEKAMHCFLQQSQGEDFAGAGAAGGLAYFCRQFLGARQQSGFTIFTQNTTWPTPEEIDFVITGEGHCDAQSLMGKLPWQVIQYMQKPSFIITGGVTQREIAQYPKYLVAILPIIAEACSLEEALKEARVNLRRTAEQLANILALFPQRKDEFR